MEAEGSRRNVVLDFGDEAKSSAKGRSHLRVHYELIFWVCYVLFTIYFIVDRFIGNWMPPTHTLNFAPLNAEETPFSVLFFDNFNRATGRLLITICSALLWTQCKTSENLIQRYRPDWLVTGDLRSTHNRVHYHLGLFLCFIIYVHIFIIFIPVINGDSTLEIVDAPPSGALTPFVKADSTNLFIIAPDVFRLFLAIVLFFFVLPMSISNFLRRFNFNVAHWLHLIGVVWFCMDIMRGTHPHSQLFNAPMVVYYGLDRIVGLFVWKETWTVVDRQSFSNNLIHIYYLRSNVHEDLKSRPIGSVHYIRVPHVEPALNFSHPYTCFYNRTGESLAQLRSQAGVSLRLDAASGKLVPTEVRHTSTSSGATDGEWQVALIMRSAHENRGVNAMSVAVPLRDDAVPWVSWGPFISEYAILSRLYTSGSGALVLQATSAGLSYIVDFALYVRASNLHSHRPVHVLLSTRSFPLIQWALQMLLPLLEHHQWHLHARYTDESVLSMEPLPESAEQSLFRSRWNVSSDSLNEVLLQLEDQHLLNDDAHVFFCGDPQIQWLSENVAADFEVNFYRGSRFSSSSFPMCVRSKQGALSCFICPKGGRNRKHRKCWCNSFPNCWCY